MPWHVTCLPEIGCGGQTCRLPNVHRMGNYLLVDVSPQRINYYLTVAFSCASSYFLYLWLPSCMCVLRLDWLSILSLLDKMTKWLHMIDYMTLYSSLQCHVIDKACTCTCNTCRSIKSFTVLIAPPPNAQGAFYNVWIRYQPKYMYCTRYRYMYMYNCDYVYRWRHCVQNDKTLLSAT